MASEQLMYSFLDLAPYSLPIESLFGNLRSTTKFARVEEIADGPTSQVFKAKDIETNNVVAMKHLKLTSKSPNSLQKEVLREITILKSLDHGNIIRLLEVVTGTNNLCLILEYCPVPLTKYLERYPNDIPHSQLKCIARHMFKGIDYLHKNMIMHRDLKTDNLMISEKGVLKIIDLGSSRRISYNNKSLTPQVFTRWYQPPEILLQSTSYNLKADMWSAGCILGELFNRKPILKGESEIQQICLIIDLIGTPTSNIWPGLSQCRVPKTISLKRQPFNMLQDYFRNLNPMDALDIISRLLVYNPDERLSAEECLEQDWFEKAPFPAHAIQVLRSSNDPLMIMHR